MVADFIYVSSYFETLTLKL